MVAPFPDRPSIHVTSPDGTRIAVFSAPAPVAGPSSAAIADRPRRPLLLVHGTTADHRTWRVVGPELARRWPVHAIDRRGRGDSGDAAEAYAIERELEDVAVVAEVLATAASVDAIDVVGHSLGGRIALGASSRTTAIRRVVAYESAPTAAVRAPGSRDALLDALRTDLVRGDNEALLARFMREAVGMPEPDLAAFRADPVWPLRAAAAPTIVRELEAAEAAPAISLEALARVTVPVLQLAGSAGPATFRDGAAALDARLADGRLVIIEGARHAAHHSHPAAFIAAVEAFLSG
jgi:pimeloyl-ACP methyl ester carboxylesterase